MAFDVFISHSSKDKTVADATCAFLESRGIRCWIAPRDIRPGDDWGSAILHALRSARVMVLIFSSHANSSPQIKREVERAVNAGATIIPMRIEAVLPQESLDYFLGTPHWLDAFTAPLEGHLERLATVIKEILATPAPVPEVEAPSTDVATPEAEPKPEMAEPLPAAAEIAPEQLPGPRRSGKGWIVAVGVVGVLGALAIAFGAYHYLSSSPSKPFTQSQIASPSSAAPAPPPSPVAAPSQAAGRPVGPVAGQPWANSLGMKFVPAGTDGVLFCIWDVRVKDYRAFRPKPEPSEMGVGVLKVTKKADGHYNLGWETDPGASWAEPGFTQHPNHPVVGVNWNDAMAFCDWLTKKERAEGKLGPNQSYRLPMDAEWSRAAGGGIYPWGDAWPPPDKAGNYGDQVFAASLPGTGWSLLPENDGFAHTSPVENYPPNLYGLHDMGGNVWQWCMDWYRAAMNSEDLRRKFSSLNNDGGGSTFKVLRGASWRISDPERLRTDFRDKVLPTERFGGIGFRLVLVVGS